jgi:hypothetical protein
MKYQSIQGTLIPVVSLCRYDMKIDVMSTFVWGDLFGSTQKAISTIEENCWYRKRTTTNTIWLIRVTQITANRRRPMWIGHIRVATKSQTTSQPISQNLLETPVHRPCFVDANLLKDLVMERSVTGIYVEFDIDRFHVEAATP